MGALLKDLFLNVLNMSITASYVILFVLLARLFLKKVPKIFSYSLWAVVLFRLVCPFSFSSVFSFFSLLKRSGMEFIPGDFSLFTNPQGNGGTYVIPKQSTSSLTDVNQIISGNPIAITNLKEKALFIISLIWALGLLSLIIYSIVSYVLLKRKINTAMPLDSKVYECENITSPFVLGIIKPMIYLPMALQENQRDYIIKHEEIHIKRLDYLVKPFAFLVLCIHWLNPLVWISFLLMNKDMEMSCDEHVLKEMGMDIKKAYSSSLLSLAVDRKIIGASPLAFGESNTKSRIKNVLNYRKPAFWVVVLGVLVICIISVGLMANPRKDTAEFVGVKIEEKKPEISSEIAAIVEDSLTSIMSSPLESSNPEDYIKANQNAYENIIKYGSEEALTYMLSQFREGNAEGLRGQIMMRLCKELLGQRNNVIDDTLSPEEWFSQLSIRQEIEMPDFVYSGDDPIERLVYDTEVQKHRSSRGGFTIVALHIFGSYEEGNKLKVFVTTYGSSYILYDKTLEQDGGSIIPAAITYTKNLDGSYTLEKYEQAKDGTYFGSSIREFCVMPSSGKKISGLSEKIFSHYGDYEDIIKLEHENLIKHLKVNNQNGVSLYQKRYKEPAELVPLTYDI
ncbi:MAG: antirepressor regulating drug resistance protein [Clostridiales bacterium]|nr:antirepressor regulating drug resistance protein [Clostridiales bacterium]